MTLNDQVRLKIMLLREKRGLSQTQLANRMGISRSHMNKLENGTLHYSLVYLKQISEILEIPMSELLNEDEKGVERIMVPFDFEGVNKEIMTIHQDDDFCLTVEPKDVLVTSEKLTKWKEDAGPGAIVIGAAACRYLILAVDSKPHPEKNGFLKLRYGFVNIDHASWELCQPTFDSTDDLIEWFASTVENPVIDVIPSKTIKQSLPGEEYV